MGGLDEAAWDAVRLEFQQGAVKHALAFAAPLQLIATADARYKAHLGRIG